MPQDLFNEIGTNVLADSYTAMKREPIRELRGIDGVRTYRQMMLNSPIIAAMLRAVEMSVRGAGWRFEAATDGDERQEFLEGALEDMSQSWDDHISQAMDVLVYGWSWFEVVYKRRQGREVLGIMNLDDGKQVAAPAGSIFDDGKIGWRKFALRSQDTMHPTDPWVYSEDGGILGFRQMLPGQFGPDAVRTIPLAKSVLYRTTSKDGNPEGLSVLRQAYRPWYFASQLEEIEAIGLERDLNGLPVLQEQAGSSANLEPGKAAYDDAIKLLRRIRNDEAAGALVPKEFILSLMSGGSGKADAIRNAIMAHEHNIALSMLVGFLMLGRGDTGTQALSRTQSQLFYGTLGAWAGIIKETQNRHVIPKLLFLNGYDLNEHPQLTHDPLDAPDNFETLKAAGDLMLKTLLTYTPETEAWARELLGAPPVEIVDEEPLPAPAPEPPPDEPEGDMDEGDEDMEGEQFAATPRTEWEALDPKTRRELTAMGKRILGAADVDGRLKRLRAISDAEWAQAVAADQEQSSQEL
jgi:hypothetical protein